MKLSDTQTQMLTAAAEQQDRLVKPPAIPPGPRGAIEAKLRSAGLIEPVPLGGDEHPAMGWRHADGEAIGYRITDGGLRAIGVEPDGAGEDNEQSAAAIACRNAERLAAAKEAPTVAVEAPEEPMGDEDADVPQADSGAPGAASRASLREVAQRVVQAWDDEANQRYDLADAIDVLRTVLASKVARATREPGTPRTPRKGTKQQQVLALLRQQEGTSIAQIIEATGWQPHTVRGFLAGLKTRQGLAVEVLERVRQVGPNKQGAKGSYSIYRIAG